MKEVTIKLYTFNELTEKVQKELIEKNQYHETEHDDWHSPIIEGFEEDLKNIGLEEITSAFTGFWSQGDGACFIGDVYDNEGFINVLKETEYLGKTWGEKDDLEMLEITIDKITHHYEHENTITGNVSSDAVFTSNLDELENAVTKWARDKSRELYKSLEKYYDELASDENVIEYLEEQGEVFQENGKRL